MPAVSTDTSSLVCCQNSQWRQTCMNRVSQLEHEAEERLAHLSSQTAKFTELKDAFKFNLDIIQERDDELSNYDKRLTDLKAIISTKDVEISDLRTLLDRAKKQFSCELSNCENQKQELVKQCREKDADFLEYKRIKDSEWQSRYDEMEALRVDMELKRKQTETELHIQRQELTTGFNEAMRQKEQEYKRKLSSSQRQLDEGDIRIKLLEKEVEILRDSSNRTIEDMHKVNDESRGIQEALNKKIYEIEELRALTDAKIKDLNVVIATKDKELQVERDQFNKRHNDLDRKARKLEATVEQLKAASRDEKQTFEARVVELTTASETTVRDMQEKTTEYNNSLQLKSDTIEQLKEELNTAQNKLAKFDSIDVDKARGQAEVIRKYEERVEGLTTQNRTLDANIKRYQSQLEQSLERYKNLEKSKTQMELDYQRKLEVSERDQYGRTDGLIQRLTESRDLAVADSEERSTQIEQKDLLIAALTKDRDEAFEQLRSQGLSGYTPMQSERDELNELKQQNEQLKAVIRHMREQVQLDVDESPDLIASRSQYKVSEGYVKALEEEVKQLKAQIRSMESQTSAQTEQSAVKLLASKHLENADFALKQHVEALNNDIGKMRHDKLELAAETKRQQARIEHLDLLVQKLSQEPREKQAKVDQLQYDQLKRHESETQTLRSQIERLKMQLDESNKQADEYYKGTIERNLEVVSLANEVAKLKSELGRPDTKVNYGAQELLIQQLNDEIAHLKRVPQSSYLPISASNSEMESKLRAAVRCIKRLLKDRDRLEAELQRVSKGRHFTKERIEDTDQQIQSDVTKPISEGRLSQLQQLQYGLTKQELQFAASSSKPSEPPPLRLSDQPKPPSLDTEQTPPASGSSLGDGSIHDVWRLLDAGSSPTFLQSTRLSQPIVVEDHSIQKPTEQQASLSKRPTSKQTSIAIRGRSASIVAQRGGRTIVQTRGRKR